MEKAKGLLYWWKIKQLNSRVYVECQEKNLGVLILAACSVLSPLSSEDQIVLKISKLIIILYLLSQTETDSFDLTKFKV